MRNIENSHGHPTEWYRERTAFLAECLTPERNEALRRVIAGRTRYMTVCMENTFYAHNASALIRHCDAFGIQDIHTVENLCRFSPSTDIVRGTDQWVTFRRHKTTAEAIATLREGGYRIVATTPHRGDTAPEDFDVEAGPFALVFGTEKQGISDEIIEAADQFVRIPMCGFVESLNVSASAAILIYMLSQKVRNSGLRWQLPEREQAEELFLWTARSLRNPAEILKRYESLNAK